MALRSSTKAEIVLARSKRTNEKYPARTSHLSGSHPKPADLEPSLHYTDDTHLQACRCLEVKEHDRAHLIDDDDKNLAIAITRYMDKFGLDSCLKAAFYRYRERQKMEWALHGVRAERFHYSSRGKDIVCRCDTPQHRSLRRVNSPKVQELCAEFFQLNTTDTICTREQWRKVDKTSARQSVLNADFSQVGTSLSISRRDSFEYDSPSVIELLKRREECPQSSCGSRSRPSSDSRARQSAKTSRMAHLRSGPNGGADIPENVWHVSRPSVYLGQYRTQSLVSTPLGSSVTPVPHTAGVVSETQDTRPSRLDFFTEALKSSSPSSARHGYTQSPSSSGLDSPIKGPENLHAAPSQIVVSPQPKIDVAVLEVRPSEKLQDSTLGSLGASTTHDNNRITGVVELPCPQNAVELDSTSTNSRSLPHHSPTLRELEGDTFGYVAELTGRRSSVRSISSKTGSPSRRLTHLVKQPLRDAGLPNQEDFFSRHVLVRSRANPAPVGICSLCQNSYHMPNNRTIQLSCGHLVHHECLISNFRSLDFEFGNCPICGMALCERTLYDRIDTDREAIFGQTFTNLKAAERIEFAQRSKSIVCWSEEEIAIAQLRLLKDYVDVHADELYRQWRQTHLEPDWYSFVVLPVVQLFKGWNLPKRKCRYFADHDAFYELVVWAELVRLMNTTHEAVKKMQGKDAQFPQLSELHVKFMLAKECYEVEKRTWSTNRSGVLECEKVAQDAFSMAVTTHAVSYH